MSYIFDDALFFGRLPDRQQTVKTGCLCVSLSPSEGFSRLFEAHDVHRRRCHGENREVPIRAWLPVANRQILGNLLFLFEPGNCITLAAEPVDELHGNALTAAEHLPRGSGSEFALVHAAALAHEGLEPVIGIADH